MKAKLVRRNILILSAGRRVELLRGFEKAAERLLPGGQVYCADAFPKMSAACQAAVLHFTLPHCLDPDYPAALRQLCTDEGIGLVIPTIDTELLTLTDLAAAFRLEGTHLVVSERDVVAGCRDKRKTPVIFAQMGLPTPAIYDIDTIEFPCFSKPADGSSSIGAMRIDGPAQITAEMRVDIKRMFMELVPDGLRELTIDLYYDRRHTLRCAVPRQRLAVRAGEVAKGLTTRDWVYDRVLAGAQSLDGARGCLTLQLFANDKDMSIHAIEINPRFGGGYPLSLAAGADFAEWLIREYLLKEDILFFEAWEDGLLMLRYDAKILVHGHR
ncbi:MAG: ATP-grasp domain-containing protein [Sphingopyxis sp.]|nr:ATP-grasp domain-containing protein [Sphingopyxis sp.]